MAARTNFVLSILKKNKLVEPRATPFSLLATSLAIHFYYFEGMAHSTVGGQDLSLTNYVSIFTY